MASSKNGIRLNFYMKPDLVEEIDAFAENLGITRSAAINVICFQWSQGMKTLNSVNAFASLESDKKKGK